ncbi:peptidylprolyl isomerase [Sphingomonas sp. SUN039]|uniref:peptidylprolyl isomerase n=1 Tax=Sphingomonas sp. SUN039 TaxID=2937787 RepID=UPI002164A926|nr:peptidylprolyl isomerase [Sphingomonas sp. SUN039]UVO54633.1 peptidylprolyl isomerase [Sphingomonas sp. SUN039]
MKFLTAFMAILAIASPALAKKKPKPVTGPAPMAAVVPDPVPTPDNLWHLQLSTGGEVVVQLRPDKAPNHIQRIKTLTRAGFYDGLLFHRVIEGFMAQTGDPQGTGQGGSPLPDLKAEFNDMPHVRGTVSMARATEPNSANSQFFIVFMPTLRLDNNYTAIGRVVSGMNFADSVERGEPPANPSKIVHAWIEADGPNAPKVALNPSAPQPVVEAPPAPPAAAPAPATKRKKVLGLF